MKRFAHHCTTGLGRVKLYHLNQKNKPFTSADPYWELQLKHFVPNDE